MVARYPPRRQHFRLLACAVVAGVLLIIGAGCHAATQRLVLEPVEGVLTLTAEAQSETRDPFLGLNAPDAGPVQRFQALTSTSGGAERNLNEIQNRDHATPVVFAAQAGLPDKIYLDVNKPIVGTFFIANTASATSSNWVEAGKVRVELWTGPTLIGGADYEITLGMTGTGNWMPFHYRFRPEIHNLSSDAILEVRVRQISGLADFLIGTGGSAQSFLEIHYFREDPLGGAIYADRPSIPPVQVEPGEEYAPSPSFEQASKPDVGPSALILAAHALAIAPLALMSRRRRPPPLLAIAMASLLVAAALSGCFSSNSKGVQVAPLEEEPAIETVNVTFIEDKTLQSGKGAIEGKVGDEFGRILAGAEVVLKGTNHFLTTKKDGAFRFSNLSAGVYNLHITAKNYKPVDADIEVQEATTSFLRITMPIPDALVGDTKPHRHDDWGGEIRKQIHEISNFKPLTCAYTCAETPAAASSWICDPHEQLCQSQIPIDTSQTILPGSGVVEVVINWQASDRSLKEIGLAYTSPASPKIENNTYLPRGPGKPFFVSMYPTEADPGHQKFTNWQFFVRAPKTDIYAPWGAPLLMTPALSVSIFAHKVVIPYEPAHNASELWGPYQELPLFTGSRVTASSLALDLPQGNIRFVPEKPRFVLAQTFEIRGTLTWVIKAPSVGAYDSPQPILYGLGYKPANKPAGEWEKSLKIVEGQRTKNSLTFAIRIDPNEIDQFYQQESFWQFYPVDDQARLGPTTSGVGMQGTVEFTLDATIHRAAEVAS